MHRPAFTACDPAPRRAVLIGASNLVRGLPWAVGAARQRLGGPLDLLVANGCGRSFGGPSRFLGRTLPGILECGIWPALEARPPAPTWALVTDLGNDIVYGHSVETIRSWLDRCLERLAAAGATVVITRPPVDSVRRTGTVRFGLVRSLLFPTRRLSRRDAIAAVDELDAAVLECASAYEAVVVEPQPHWFGVDPIHVRGRFVPEAWVRMTAPWSAEPPDAPLRPARLPRMRPALRWVGSRREETRQPTARLEDGTVVAMY